MKRRYILGVIGIDPPAPSSGDNAIAQITTYLNSIYARREGDKLIPRTVTNTTAAALATIALATIKKALDANPSGAFVASQKTSILNRKKSIEDHVARIAAETKQYGAAAAYSAPNDLRKDVLDAFVQLDGALEAAKWASRLSLWGEVTDQFEKVLVAVYKAEQSIKSAAGEVLDKAKEGLKAASYLVPIGLGVVGVLAFAAWMRRRDEPAQPRWGDAA